MKAYRLATAERLLGALRIEAAKLADETESFEQMHDQAYRQLCAIKHDRDSLLVIVARLEKENLTLRGQVDKLKERFRRHVLGPLCLLVMVCLASGARAQDRRGEVTTTEPSYAGVTANAPIDPRYHILNEGGSDGAGLCVISSVLCNGGYQGVPGLERGKESTLWKTAKSRPGGYYPEKLERLLKELMPGEEWFSWEGDGTELLARYSAQGYPIAATMNTGELYNWQPIHHMISLAHLDDSWACVIDNNDPGKYHWMPAAEYARRFRDGPKGWGFVWLRSPDGGRAMSLLPLAVLISAAGFLVVWVGRPRNLESLSCSAPLLS